MTAGGKLNLVELFIAGGWVMYPIALLSVVMMAITLERLIVIFLEKWKFAPSNAIKIFAAALDKHGNDKVKAIDEITPVLKKKGTILSEILLTIIEKYHYAKDKNLSPMEMKSWLKNATEEKAGVELPALDAHLGWLAIISNVATLVGLFGTVIGMIESFTAMSNSAGGVKADEMAGGIAVALVATAGGLVVAVPSLLIFNWLKNTAEAHVIQIEETTVKVIDTLAE